MSNLIDIEVNGQYLDMNDQALRLEIVNSMLETALYQGDYSFPFEVPATPHNLKLFGYANSIDVTDRVTQHDCTLYLFGIPKYSPKLKLVKLRNRSFSIVLIGGIKGLSIADKKLSEIDLGADFNLGNNQDTVLAQAKLAAEEGNYQTYGFTFVPFYQPNFYNGLNPSFNGVVNRVNSTTGAIKGNPTTLVNNQYTLVPWVFLYYVLSRIFKLEQLIPSGTAWNHNELNKLLLTNNRSIEVRPTDDNTHVSVLSNQNLTADGQKIDYGFGLGDYDNLTAWDDAADQYIIKKAGVYNFKIHLHANIKSTATFPPPTLDGGRFQVIYDSVNIKNIPIDKGSFYNYYTAIVQITALVGDIGKAIYVQYDHSSGTFQTQTYVELSTASYFDVTLDKTSAPADTGSILQFKNHVPDWTVGALLAEVKKLGINFDFNFRNGTVTIDTVKTIYEDVTAIELKGKANPNYELSLEEADKGYKINYEFNDGENPIEIPADKLMGEFFVDDVADLPAPNKEGDYAIMAPSNEVYMIIKSGVNLNEWQKVGNNYKAYQVGNGGNDTSLKLAPVQMTIATNEGGTAEENRALMPYFESKGSSEIFGLGIEPVIPRLCFWRGYNKPGGKDVPKGGKYILANTDLYGINADVVGELSFRLDRKENLVRFLSEQVLIALNASQIAEVDMYLTAIDFEKIKTTGKLIYDFNVFLIKSLSVSVSKRVCVTKGYLLKI